MKIYEIFIAELGTYVKFKLLEPAEVEAFVQEVADLERDDYIKHIIEHVVYNMRTEIIESLKFMSRSAAKQTLKALYNGCVMLNPGLDIETWISLAFFGANGLVPDSDSHTDLVFSGPPDPFGSDTPELPASEDAVMTALKKMKPKKLTKAKFLNLPRALKEAVIGQDQAIDILVKALKRSQAGLNDEGRPLGVFLFAGSSGVGKTHLARELHKYLYGDENDMVRIDCGEFQHKHDNQKLIGSPPGYIAHEDGGQLTNQVRNNPNTVILLDEVEKAHIDIWNTFLRVFDEGILTDNKGRKVDFRNTVIIMTTNLGNDKMVELLTAGGVGFGARVQATTQTRTVPTRDHTERVVNDAIKKLFKPEFLNRIDQTVVFNYLNDSDFRAIADLEIQKVADKLSRRGISINYDESVLELLVEEGVDSVRGARGMAKIRREKIEDIMADLLLDQACPKGTILDIATKNHEFYILREVRPPKKQSSLETN